VCVCVCVLPFVVVVDIHKTLSTENTQVMMLSQRSTGDVMRFDH